MGRYPDEYDYWLDHEYEEDEDEVDPDRICRCCHEECDRLYHGVCIDCLKILYDEHVHEMYDFFKNCDPEEEDPLCPAPLDVMWNGSRYEFDEYLRWFAFEDEWYLAEYFDEKGWIDEAEDEWYRGENEHRV